MPLSDAYRENLIKALLAGANFTSDATLYFALCTVGPDPDGTGGTEVSGTGYARQALTASTGWSDDGEVDGAYQLSNSAAISFGDAGGPWGEITHVAILNHATDPIDASTLIYVIPLDVSRVINGGENVQFAAGDLRIRLDGDV